MKIVVLDANAFWTEQLYSACANFAEVLLLKPRDFRAHQQRQGTWKSDAKPREIGDGVWEQHLSMPPGWMFSLWGWIERSMAKHIRHFAGDDQLVLVITYPQYRSLIGRLRPGLSVYYNLDDYSDNWPVRAAAISKWEMETVAIADLTICIAQYRAKLLRDLVPRKADRIFHLPLGCTPEFMADLSVRKIPNELTGIARPICGHIGALNSRFDFEFLANVAKQIPAANFVLGGKIPRQNEGSISWRRGYEQARQLPNVHFIGWIEHARLGEYLNGCDALFMCYSDCRFNRNACPAKLWDYMGIGRPIVANKNNPETLLWRDSIYIGATPPEFAAQVEKALNETDAALRQRRLEIAQAHTWERLSYQLEKIVRSALSVHSHRQTQLC